MVRKLFTLASDIVLSPEIIPGRLHIPRVNPASRLVAARSVACAVECELNLPTPPTVEDNEPSTVPSEASPIDILPPGEPFLVPVPVVALALSQSRAGTCCGDYPVLQNRPEHGKRLVLGFVTRWGSSPLAALRLAADGHSAQPPGATYPPSPAFPPLALQKSRSLVGEGMRSRTPANTLTSRGRSACR